MDDEDFKRRYALQRIELEHRRSVELVKATAAFEHAALAPPLLLNGGALVVYVALFGALRSSGQAGIDLYYALAAMAVWMVGLLLSSAAIACAYFSQKRFEKAQRRRLEALDAELAGDQRRAGNRQAVASGEDRRGRGQRNWASFFVVFGILAFAIGVGLGTLAVI